MYRSHSSGLHCQQNIRDIPRREVWRASAHTQSAKDSNWAFSCHISWHLNTSVQKLCMAKWGDLIFSDPPVYLRSCILDIPLLWDDPLIHNTPVLPTTQYCTTLPQHRLYPWWRETQFRLSFRCLVMRIVRSSDVVTTHPGQITQKLFATDTEGCTMRRSRPAAGHDPKSHPRGRCEDWELKLCLRLHVLTAECEDYRLLGYFILQSGRNIPTFRRC